MKELDIYRLGDITTHEDLDKGHEGEALHDICARYFQGNSELFRILTQTPQKTCHILDRQRAIQDILSHGADSIFGSESKLTSLSEQVGSPIMVKVWKEINTHGRTRREPFIYDHRKLGECVERFQALCKDILESLEHVTSTPLIEVRDFFSQFVDDSEVTRGWSQDREILAESKMPFLALVTQDPWSHKIEGLEPLGSIAPEEADRMQKVIRNALRSGDRKATITVGGEVFELNFVLAGCPYMRPKHKNEPKTGRFIDFDLFAGLRWHIEEAQKTIKDLSFYRAAANMHKNIVKRDLPVCFPIISRENRLEIENFYPLHLGLKRRNYIFNSIHLTPENPFALITGKNNGGKSTVLEVLHLIASMTRAGVSVPATSATIGNFDTIIHRRIVGEDRGHGRGTLLNQAYVAEGDLGKLFDSQSGIGFFDEPVSGTDSATNEKGLDEALQILIHEVKRPTVIVTHCTRVAQKVSNSSEQYPGVQLFCFKKGETSKPDRKMYLGVGESDGGDQLQKAGLTLTSFRKRHKRK